MVAQLRGERMVAHDSYLCVFSVARDEMTQDVLFLKKKQWYNVSDGLYTGASNSSKGEKEPTTCGAEETICSCNSFFWDTVEVESVEGRHRTNCGHSRARFIVLALRGPFVLKTTIKRNIMEHHVPTGKWSCHLRARRWQANSYGCHRRTS